MKITKNNTFIVILLIIFIILLAACFFLSPDHRNVGMDNTKEDNAPPLPTKDMDMAYIYTDNQGVAHFSEQPPVGYDYQVVYIPKRTAVEKRDQLRLNLAEKAKKIMRGKKDHDETVKKPMNTGREFHQLPRTTAGDILSKSNELRQNEEKQDNHTRSEPESL